MYLFQNYQFFRICYFFLAGISGLEIDPGEESSEIRNFMLQQSKRIQNTQLSEGFPKQGQKNITREFPKKAGKTTLICMSLLVSDLCASIN